MYTDVLLHIHVYINTTLVIANCAIDDVNVRLLLSRKICYTWSLSSRGGVVQWIDHLTRNWSVVTLKPTIASSRRLFYNKILYPFGLVLICSRNGFELDSQWSMISWEPYGRITCFLIKLTRLNGQTKPNYQLNDLHKRQTVSFSQRIRLYIGDSNKHNTNKNTL